jgi:hypothetical protein
MNICLRVNKGRILSKSRDRAPDNSLEVEILCSEALRAAIPKSPLSAKELKKISSSSFLSKAAKTARRPIQLATLPF